MRALIRVGSVLSFILVGFVMARAADMKPDEIVTRHLDSIATPAVRAGVQSRVVLGSLKFSVLVNGGGTTGGDWGRVSSGRMSNFVMRFGLSDWRGEQFVFDGSKSGFTSATDSHRRSDFAAFVSSQDFMVKEGLLGGELSTGWALQNLAANHARVENLGMKKIDGKQLIGVQYFSKRTNDMQVRIYFDPATFNHVMTSYSMEIATLMTGNITTSSSQKPTRYTLEERFGDFQTADGITLPRHYQLQWTQDLQSGTTQIFDWDMMADQIRNNAGIDPANFKVK